MEKKYGLGVFGKYLTLWVAACIIAGIAIGKYLFSWVWVVFLFLGIR